MITVPFSSKAFVAGVLAYFPDLTLHRRDSSIRKDRGKHWWDKFRSFKGDTRSEEFYSLTFNLNNYFPSVWCSSATLCWMYLGLRMVSACHKIRNYLCVGFIHILYNVCTIVTHLLHSNALDALNRDLGQGKQSLHVKLHRSLFIKFVGEEV